VVGEAEGAAETARLAAYRELDQATLLGLAVKELAGNLPAVDTLVLSPDMLTPLLTRLTAGAGGNGNGKADANGNGNGKADANGKPEGR
jgi:hypothetical protein